MKYLLLFVVFIPFFSQAEDLQPCGVTSIEQVITGPRHGVLLNLSNDECGNSGYVCIDIDPSNGSNEIGKAAYSFALAMYMSSTDVQITVDPTINPSSCGGNFPAVEDIRNDF